MLDGKAVKWEFVPCAFDSYNCDALWHIFSMADRSAANKTFSKSVGRDDCSQGCSADTHSRNGYGFGRLGMGVCDSHGSASATSARLKSTWIMTLAAWLTWGMAMSEVANSWWGTTQTLPIAASQSAADGGKPWQELVVTIAHFAAGLGLIIAWVLLLIGFVKQPTDESSVH
jgi:hypothetical protein